jgi:hypothetical protein
MQKLYDAPRFDIDRTGNIHSGVKSDDHNAGGLEGDSSAARKRFFLKKEAKTFAYLACALGQH